MGKEKIDLSCFFCEEPIAGIVKTETRTARGDGYGPGRDYQVKTAIPVEQNVSIIEFEPDYEISEEDIKEAETKTQEIIDNAIIAGNQVLEPFREKLKDVKIVLHEDWSSMYRPEEKRSEAMNEIFKLRVYGGHDVTFCYYKLENVDEVTRRERHFLAHNNCIKTELTLEMLVTNPLVQKQFIKSLEKLPEPYQKIYDKLKNKTVKVTATPFDFREHL